MSKKDERALGSAIDRILLNTDHLSCFMLQFSFQLEEMGSSNDTFLDEVDSFIQKFADKISDTFYKALCENLDEEVYDSDQLKKEVAYLFTTDLHYVEIQYPDDDASDVIVQIFFLVQNTTGIPSQLIPHLMALQMPEIGIAIPRNHLVGHTHFIKEEMMDICMRGLMPEHFGFYKTSENTEVKYMCTEFDPEKHLISAREYEAALEAKSDRDLSKRRPRPNTISLKVDPSI